MVKINVDASCPCYESFCSFEFGAAIKYFEFDYKQGHQTRTSEQNVRYFVSWITEMT